MNDAANNIIVTIIGLGLLILCMFGYPAYKRYQRVLNVRNEALVLEQESKNTAEKVKVEQQKAQVRIEEAHGIAESQSIIDKSLTDQYLQYLAIQAQEKMAESPNHTQVYIPVGSNGIPLVKTVE